MTEHETDKQHSETTFLMNDDDRQFTPKSMAGHVDLVTSEEIVGWAWDPNNPKERISVELVCGGDSFHQVIANHSRAGLIIDGLRDGFHEFRMRIPFGIPENLDGNFCIRCLGSDYILPGSPFQIPKNSKDALSSRNLGIPQPTEVAHSMTNAIGPVTALKSPPKEFFKLFDGNYYQSQSGPVDDPLEHFVKIGWKLGLNPHPLFDTKYYCSVSGSEPFSNSDPLSHFFDTGYSTIMSTHPLFSVEIYRKTRPGVFESKLNPILHYIEHGWKESEFPSTFFSDDYYEQQCPGVRKSGMAPVIHYLTIGYKEGRKPHPQFDPKTFARYATLKPNEDPFTCFMRDTLLYRTKVNDATFVRLSIVILNLEKSLTTLQCLYFLRRLTDLNYC